VREGLVRSLERLHQHRVHKVLPAAHFGALYTVERGEKGSEATDKAYFELERKREKVKEGGGGLPPPAPETPRRDVTRPPFLFLLFFTPANPYFSSYTPCMLPPPQQQQK
jgi:hypothetical protein